MLFSTYSYIGDIEEILVLKHFELSLPCPTFHNTSRGKTTTEHLPPENKEEEIEIVVTYTLYLTTLQQ